MRRLCVLGGLVVAWVGCDFGGPKAGAGDDARPVDASDARPPIDEGPCVSFSSQLDTCALAPPSGAVTITANKFYNTDTHELSDFPSGLNKMVLGSGQQADVTTKAGPANVMLATTFQLMGGRSLHVIGSKPFGIIATEVVTIDGTIDATSTAAGLSGAGARDATACGTATPAKPPNHEVGMTNGGGAPGGGGGAFQGKGGKGQDSDNNEQPQVGGAGGVVPTAPIGPTGGCAGANGASTNMVTGAGGAGGRGGGAIYIVSKTSIVVHGAGVLTAGGAGGGGGHSIDGGGGGGGSGGMVIVEAPSVDITGKLAANGGGGGGGAGGGGSGGPGQDAHPDDTTATGGSKAGSGGVGVAGSAKATLDGTDNPGRPDAAGGGGGGGAGFTVVLCANPQLGGTFSPPIITSL